MRSCSSTSWSTSGQSFPPGSTPSVTRIAKIIGLFLLPAGQVKPWLAFPRLFLIFREGSFATSNLLEIAQGFLNFLDMSWMSNSLCCLICAKVNFSYERMKQSIKKKKWFVNKLILNNCEWAVSRLTALYCAFINLLHFLLSEVVKLSRLWIQKL